MSYKLILEKFSIHKRSSELQKIFFNTGWLFADRILRMGIGLFVMIRVARYLGVEQFGVFNYASAFVALFGIISTLGLPSLVVRNLIQSPEQKEHILGTTFWLQLLGGFLTSILTVTCILIFKPDDPLIINLVAILASISIFQSFDTIDLWFQSQVKSKYTVLAKNTAFVIVAIIKINLINLYAPLLAFAWATLAEFIIGAVGLIIAYQWQGYSLKLWRFSLSLAKKLLQESWPFILTSLSVIIYMKIDQIMIGSMVGAKALGLYSSATRISEVWYFIPTTIVSSVAPSIYHAKKEGNESVYYQRITQLLRLLNFIAVGIAIPMTFFSRIFITFLFGNDYAEASSILSIHIWASLFIFMSVATSVWFTAEGLTHLFFRATFFGAIINIVLNFWLIPAYSGLGAAISTIISYGIALFIANIFNLKTKKIFIVQMRSLFLIK